ncbi:MAG: hypothetical protein HY513_02155 [Candidatus Aenigmarchaeota archaeon]|nr:hypothetical protein [Candidatus Aenigmarchaeota archaeon]
MVISSKKVVVTTKVVKIKERVIKQRYMGKEVKFLVFDICESMYAEANVTVNMYREVWVQDEENNIDPQLDHGDEGEIEVEAE